MSNTLIEILEKNHSTSLNYAMIPVTIKEQFELNNGFTLNKPCFAVLDTGNKKTIALHGKDYNLIPYAEIIKGLNDALINYGIKLDNVNITFNVDTDLNYMRLRILFNNIAYGLKYNDHDKLNLAIEVISSYDASIIFKLRTMFFRLICSNGMSEIIPIASSFKKHTTNLDFMNEFHQLEGFESKVNLLANQFEPLTKVKLTSTEIDRLFKSFGKTDNRIYLLNELMDIDLKKIGKSRNRSTLFDVYNAVTNYSSNNQQAKTFGKRDNAQYKIEGSSMDEVKSNSQREVEVDKFLKSKLFLFFYNKGLGIKSIH